MLIRRSLRGMAPQAHRTGTFTLAPGGSVTGLPDNRGGAASVEQELTKFLLDLLVTPADEVRHVLDVVNLLPLVRERLWRDSRTITVMNAGLSPLEDDTEPVSHATLAIVESGFFT